MMFYGLILVSSVILMLRFFDLQIMQENIYREKSNENSVKKETQIPVRGLIYDRHGQLIADNRPSFSLYLVPAQTTPSTVSFLANALQVEEKEIKKKFRRSRRFQPVKIARYVDYKTLTLLQENKLDLPGLEWKVEPKRNYHFDRSFAHVLGTLGEIGEGELSRSNDYEAGDIVGKKGIEKALDKELRGRKGFRIIQVDALGRSAGDLVSEKNRLAYPGKDLYLSIDARLQLYADSLMSIGNGALVAVDVRNGEILTLVSKPDYDLNLFAEAIQAEVWSQLMADTLKPLFDRATQATYPPGSTYKMVAAIAALNEGIVNEKWSVFCPGYYRIGRRIVRCWNPEGHGEVNVTAAIRHSCNVYFYQLGLKIGIDLWTKYSKIFQFGEKTGMELQTEKPGLVPSREYYNKVYGKGRWSHGMIANIAIGQGELLVTPLQMAQFAMMLADSGSYFQPHLTRKMIDKITGEIDSVAAERKTIEGIKPEVFRIVREGMRQVVAGGTGWRAGVWRISGGGKTGTAQTPPRKSHAWYIGFAPYENPEIAIALIIENGGSGGGIAAPVAGKYLQRYFHYKGEFNYKEYREFQRILWAKQQEQARLDSLRSAGVMISEEE